MGVNCKGLEVQPNLRLVNDQLELINFDEASLTWCLGSKKNLQGLDMFVTVGDAGVGMYAYDVPLNGIKMVICSNAWASFRAGIIAVLRGSGLHPTELH